MTISFGIRTIFALFHTSVSPSGGKVRSAHVTPPEVNFIIIKA